MRLFLNLNNGIVTTAIHLSLAANANARRGGREQVELQLHRDRVPERLPENWLILLGVKETGRYDAPAFLTQASAWSRPDADDGFYTAWLPTDTGPINSLLRHDNDDTNDIPTAATMAQIDWRPDINTPPSKSQSFTINFQSAVNNGDETPSAPETPFAALFIQNRFDLDDFTGGTPSDLDSIATTDLAVGTTIEMVAAAEGVVSQWRLTAGTDAENEAGGIVRPDDYAPATNEKVWVRIM
jgi:hypothetical protein